MRSEFVPVSVFPDQLPREPHVSRIYIDSFEGENNGVYKFARRQNYSMYEEGRDRLIVDKTKAGISQALQRL